MTGSPARAGQLDGRQVRQGAPAGQGDPAGQGVAAGQGDPAGLAGRAGARDAGPRRPRRGQRPALSAGRAARWQGGGRGFKERRCQRSGPGGQCRSMMWKWKKDCVGACCDRAAKSRPSPGCGRAGAAVCCWLRCRPWRPGAPVARRRAHIEVPVKRSCPAACGPSTHGYYGAVRGLLGPRTRCFSIVPPWFKGDAVFVRWRHGQGPGARRPACGRGLGAAGAGGARPRKGAPSVRRWFPLVAWAGQHRNGCPCNQSACCASTGGHRGGRGFAVHGQQACDRL
jgi:hypothetical protein